MAASAIILAYHRICPKEATNTILHDTIVEPRIFDEHLRFLSRNFRVLSLVDFLKTVQTRDKLKENIAIITFDDNYYDNFAYVLPLLKKYAFPATIFVSTAFINTDRVFWWDRLAHILSQSNAKPTEKQKAFFRLSGQLKKYDFKEQDEFLTGLCRSLEAEEIKTLPRLLNWEDLKTMLKEGVSFGSHGHTHRVFSALDSAEALKELALSKESLESNLKTKVVGVAFPHGEETDFNHKLMPELLQKAGYRCGLTMTQGQCRQEDNIYCLPRIGIGCRDMALRFSLKLNGVIPRLSKIKKGLYGIIGNNQH